MTSWLLTVCEVLPDLAERVKLTADQETFLAKVTAKVLNFCDTTAVRTSLEGVWLALDMDILVNTSDRLK